MSSIIKSIAENKFFYSLNFALLTVVIVLLSCFTKADSFIWLNQFHTKFLNYIFECLTFLGDGWFVIVFSLVFIVFFKDHRALGLIILLSYISSGIFAQFIKNIIVAPRPKVYFELHHIQYYLDTFASSRIGLNSFPSGHTASFFAFATVISNYCKRKYICITMPLLSILVGYSRIYLGHHFLMDVFAGALIGVAFGSLSSIWFNQITENTFIKRKIYFPEYNTHEFSNPGLSQH